MKRMKIMALAAVAAFAAMAVMAGSAFAGKAPLTLVDPAGPVPTGETITAVSHNLKTLTSIGTLECEFNVLPIKVGINGAAKDIGTAEEDQAYGSFFEGPPYNIAHSCDTNGALGIAPTIIKTLAFPWKVEFKPKGANVEMVVKGTKKVTFNSQILNPEWALNEDHCQFEGAKIVSTAPNGAPKAPKLLEITTTAQTFKGSTKIKEKAPVCPETGSLSGEWLVEDSNGPVSVE